MARLIDADALKKNMESVCMGIMVGTESYRSPLKEIDDAPTVDSVKHGRWEDENMDDQVVARCSVCNTWDTTRTPYCPHCGALMDEEDK